VAASLIARKAARLVDVIDDLRGRLRRVFAAELSRAVAETVRDVLAALLGGRPGPAWGRPAAGDEADQYAGAGWDDAAWAADPFGRYADPDDDDDDDDDGVTPAARPAPDTAAVLTLAVAAGGWLARHSRSRLCGAAAALAVGAAAVFGGPAAKSVLAVVAAVHQLAGTGAGDVLNRPSD